MGQINNPTAAGILLSSVDRLLATNAGAGLSPAATHVILLGADAGLNMGAVTNAIAIGWKAGQTVPAAGTGLIALGVNSANGLSTANGIILGNNSVKGPLTQASMDDLISIGNRSWPLLTTGGAASLNYGMISIGSDIGLAKTVTNFDASIFIGNEIFFTDDSAGSGSAEGTIVIGHGFMRNAVNGSTTKTGDSIFIGNDILKGAFNGITLTQSVIIGRRALVGMVAGGGSCASSVIIGANLNAVVTGGNICDFGNSVVIGQAAQIVASAANGDRTLSVVIGDAASLNGPGAIMFGVSNQGSRGDRVRIIGAANNFGASGTGWANNFIIGNDLTTASVGTTMDAGGFFMLCRNITNQLMFGNFASGNIVLGNSTNAQKDLETIAGTNQVKLVNGTRGGGGNPTTGGFFYVSAGALHWVGSAGTDTVVAPA
jgi:hypothetical protein